MDEAERLMFEGWATLPRFKKKVEQAQGIIKEALKIAPAYVAISWGKDSTVLLHLCQQIKPDILAFHYGSEESKMGVTSNFPEVIDNYLERFPTNYQELIGKPEWAFTPDTVRDRIQSAINPLFKIALVGVRAEESKYRRMAIKQYGVIHQYKSDNLWRAFPLAYWKYNDIWSYIVKYRLPYLEAYKYSNRTNPHASFWFSQNKDFVATQREVVKRHNPTLDQMLKDKQI